MALGALGAHGLKSRVEPTQLTVFETGVRYHVYHALALCLCGLWAAQATPARQRLLRIAGWTFLIGVMVFSGSLYLLAVTDIRWLGAITPLGGTAFVVGWALLMAWALRGREQTT